MDRKTSLLGETIQDVTLTAWPIVWADNEYDQDSREVLEMLREWAEKFQDWWDSKAQDWRDRHSYLEEVENFAKRRARQYVREITGQGEVVMGTTQNHNPALVDQINEKWGLFKEAFRPVLCALYERDLDEILACESFGYGPDSCARSLVLDDLQDHWEDYAENYLMHVADDQDLEAIIKFVRYDRSENA